MNQRALGLVLQIAFVLALPLAATAQITVLTSGGFVAAYQELRPTFEKAYNLSITTLRGASQGTGPDTIGAQLRRGVHADIVIMSRDGLNELIAQGRIAAGTPIDLARVPLGVAVRAGAPRPDISTVEAFKQTLLRAKSIGVQSTSAIYMTTKLLPKLGIAKAVSGKLNNGGAAAIAAGETEIAVLPVSELLRKSGVAFIGTIPAEIQLVQIFSVAVLADSKELRLSRQLIAFLASEDARAAIRNSGMEPVGSR
ncbi:MAG: substrate-binding domain-containing protein [Bryobacteraceae bacterium]